MLEWVPIVESSTPWYAYNDHNNSLNILSEKLIEYDALCTANLRSVEEHSLTPSHITVTYISRDQHNTSNDDDFLEPSERPDASKYSWGEYIFYILGGSQSIMI